MSKFELTPDEANADSKASVVHFTFETGLRFLTVPPEASVEIEDSMVCAEITADILSEYRLTDNVDKRSLKAFGARNALCHVWPYWREIIQNMATRFRLPPFPLPMYQIPATNDIQEVSDDAPNDDSSETPTR